MRVHSWVLPGTVVFLIACGGGDPVSPPPPPPPPPPSPVTSVTVTPPTADIPVGGAVQLSATPRDAQNNPLTGRQVDWTSANPNVATVSGAGLVTGVNAGQAEIRATSENRTGTAIVTVTQPAVASVTLSATEATLLAGDVLALEATARDAGGAVLTGRAVTWSTSAPGVATVSNAGLVTAGGLGQATVTATIEGHSAAAEITVGESEVVSADGGGLDASNGQVSLAIPAGALPGATTMTVTPMVSPPGANQIIAGTAYEFGPSGTQFALPVTMSITWDASNVPASVNPALLRLFALDGNQWHAVPGSTVDVGARRVSGPVAHFSGYAVGELRPPSAGAFVLDQISAGGGGTVCGLAPGGVAWCWGQNLYGQVGDGTTEDRTRPVKVDTDLRFTAISAGGIHTCAIATGGRAWCWGNGVNGALGHGASAQSSHPVPVSHPEGVTFVDITAGAGHTCGRTGDGQVLCWGAGTSGQLGNNDQANRLTPVPLADPLTFDQIHAAHNQTCGVAQGQGWCWGDNGLQAAPILGTQLGTLGVGSLANAVPRPTAVQTSQQFAEVGSGFAFSCGRTPAGVVSCWGVGVWGNLGTGSVNQNNSPTAVQGTYSSITVGSSQVCALTMTGDTVCWGRQVGEDGSEDQVIPQPFDAGGLRFTRLSGGVSVTCGLSEDHNPWCWGLGTDGRLGNGSTVSSRVPVRAEP